MDGGQAGSEASTSTQRYISDFFKSICFVSFVMYSDNEKQILLVSSATKKTCEMLRPLSLAILPVSVFDLYAQTTPSNDLELKSTINRSCN